MSEKFRALVDAMYQIGYRDCHQQRDYDPRGTREWQAVIDALDRARAEGWVEGMRDMAQRLVTREHNNPRTEPPDDPIHKAYEAGRRDAQTRDANTLRAIIAAAERDIGDEG